MRSPKLDYSYWIGLCEALFGEKVTDIRAANSKRIGRDNRHGKVIYVNSIEDPWIGVSVLPKNKPK
jgi:hypothetical protein